MAAVGMLNADLVRALEEAGPGDTTGTDTLERYLYQFKVAVLRWLGTLALDVECWLVCEFVDDITLVTGKEIVFCQVKTRDRGAWTASKVLQSGGGLDAATQLVRIPLSDTYISLRSQCSALAWHPCPRCRVLARLRIRR